jgi:hypothetical protein
MATTDLDDAFFQISLRRRLCFLRSHSEGALGFTSRMRTVSILANGLPLSVVCLTRYARSMLYSWASNSLFLKCWTLLFKLLIRPPRHHWLSCQTYSFSASWLVQHWSCIRLPNRSWTPLFFTRWSMSLNWWLKCSWMDRRLAWHCLNSWYWLLHSGQLRIIDNFKPSF